MQHDQDLVLHGRYKVVRRIGGASHCEVYHGVDVKTSQDVAIKLESIKSELKYLESEFKIYFQMQGEPGVPIIYWFGKQGEYYVLVMDIFGPQLEQLFAQSKKKFSLKTVLLIADQLLTRLELLHSKNFVHRDIKPENIAIGRGKTQHTFFLFDLTMAKQYFDPATQSHIPCHSVKKFNATPRYASVNTHNGLEQSRRDDLESLGYVLLYFLRGGLPWQGLPASSFEEQLEKIKAFKANVKVEELCASLPQEFSIYMRYCYDLKFNENPDYEYLRTIFRNLYNRSGFKKDNLYDWIKAKPVLKMPGKKDVKKILSKPEEEKDVTPFIAPVHPDAIKEVSEEDSPSPADHKQGQKSALTGYFVFIIRDNYC